MFTSEKEANHVWCPMVRSKANDDLTSNSFASSLTEQIERNPIYSRCIGAHCMMWRWRYPDFKNDDAGYCGLAGVPKY